MTHNKDALVLFNKMIDFIENCVSKYSGCNWHINDFGSKNEFETIRAALQPPVVDVDGLKREDINKPFTDRGDNDCYNEGYNAAIDHLAAKGYLNTPTTPDEAVLPVDFNVGVATFRSGVKIGQVQEKVNKLYNEYLITQKEGYVLVPIEPTYEMVMAATATENDFLNVYRIYKAMIKLAKGEA